MNREIEIKSVLNAFEKKGFETYYAENRAAALKMCLSHIEPHNKVAWGGSVSLGDIGLHDALKSLDIEILAAPYDVPFDERIALLRRCQHADVFFSGANALTRDGRMVNIDGLGNRVASSIFGPKKFIVVAGYNKIVGTLDEALYRIKFIATPKNVRRLNGKAPCSLLDVCVDCDQEQGRICNSLVVTENNRFRGRMILIIVNEKLGY